MSSVPKTIDVPPLAARPSSPFLSPDYHLPPPPLASEHSQHSIYDKPWNSSDPRSSSTQSLVPTESSRDGRRLLMLIYIHGFMGSDTSFKSFPAHVHNLLTLTLAPTHIIHTKIYPRYKSRKVIEFARDDFSKWLSPHESSLTDVVLLGHSMGGLLSAEVVLLPLEIPEQEDAFRHRILGTINFDTPFLGLHPGVILSGLGSLFQPKVEPSQQTAVQPEGSVLPASSVPLVRPAPLGQSQPSTPYQSPGPRAVSSGYFDSVENDLIPTLSTSTTSPFTTNSTDPNFNPPFPNDVRIPIRKGWSNALHFVNKHSDNITKATKQLFASHLEFGGCMADYPGLKARYTRIRGLEDLPEQDGETRRGERRVRFVNYYTASTGRPRKPKAAKDEITEALDEVGYQSQHSRSPSRSPRISVEEHRDDGTQVVTDLTDFKPALGAAFESDQISDNNSHLDMVERASSSMPEDDEPKNLSGTENVEKFSSTSVLPPLPNLLPKPPAFDPSAYPEKDTRKLAEKDHAALVRLYKQAVKDRDRAIRGREKLSEKREKKARQAQEKMIKDEEKQKTAEEKAQQKAQSKLESASETRKEDTRTSKKEEERAKKDRKFCVTPSKVDGKADPTWIRVFMKDVDEVGAHCGLFRMGEAYEKLVGDVGSRIEEWVKEDQSSRVVRLISNEVS